jgi:hypothetical protein
MFGVLVLAVGRDSKAGFTRVLSLIGAVVSFLPTIPLIHQLQQCRPRHAVRREGGLDRALQHPSTTWASTA